MFKGMIPQTTYSTKLTYLFRKPYQLSSFLLCLQAVSEVLGFWYTDSPTVNKTLGVLCISKCLISVTLKIHNEYYFYDASVELNTALLFNKNSYVCYSILVE